MTRWVQIWSPWPVRDFLYVWAGHLSWEKLTLFDPKGFQSLIGWAVQRPWSRLAEQNVPHKLNLGPFIVAHTPCSIIRDVSYFSCLGPAASKFPLPASRVQWIYRIISYHYNDKNTIHKNNVHAGVHILKIATNTTWNRYLSSWKIGILHASFWSDDIFPVGGKRNSGTHDKTFVTRSKGSEDKRQSELKVFWQNHKVLYARERVGGDCTRTIEQNQ